MKKIVLLIITMVAIATIFSFAAVTAKPPTEQPPGLETVWDAINALWTNATEQQADIDGEITDRSTADDALQTAIDQEQNSRSSADTALWTNATEQQAAIDSIDIPEVYVESGIITCNHPGGAECWDPGCDSDSGDHVDLPEGFSIGDCNIIVSPTSIDIRHTSEGYNQRIEAFAREGTDAAHHPGWYVHAHVMVWNFDIEPNYIYYDGGQGGNYLMICKK